MKKRALKIAFLTVCRAVGLFHLGRLMRGNKLLILCYHGFSSKDEDRWRPGLYLSGEAFAQRLAHVSKGGYRVLPLEEAVQKLYERRLCNNEIVITIDDGFYSVFEKALPVLQSYRFPATVYVTTYHVLKGTPV